MAIRGRRAHWDASLILNADEGDLRLLSNVYRAAVKANVERIWYEGKVDGTDCHCFVFTMRLSDGDLWRKPVEISTYLLSDEKFLKQWFDHCRDALERKAKRGRLS